MLDESHPWKNFSFLKDCCLEHKGDKLNCINSYYRIDKDLCECWFCCSSFCTSPPLHGIKQTSTSFPKAKSTINDLIKNIMQKQKAREYITLYSSNKITTEETNDNSAEPLRRKHCISEENHPNQEHQESGHTLYTEHFTLCVDRDSLPEIQNKTVQKYTLSI